ncbi:MAG: hypothetical protein AB7V04_06110 [Desulfomonilaceae bacterium]
MKENETNQSSESKTEISESDDQNRINKFEDSSIEQIDDSELPQSLKDKFKTC